MRTKSIQTSQASPSQRLLSALRLPSQASQISYGNAAKKLCNGWLVSGNGPTLWSPSRELVSPSSWQLSCPARWGMPNPSGCHWTGKFALYEGTFGLGGLSPLPGAAPHPPGLVIHWKGQERVSSSPARWVACNSFLCYWIFFFFPLTALPALFFFFFLNVQ